MLLDLFKFKGGVKPPSNKTQSNTQPIASAGRCSCVPSRMARR